MWRNVPSVIVCRCLLILHPLFRLVWYKVILACHSRWDCWLKMINCLRNVATCTTGYVLISIKLTFFVVQMKRRFLKIDISIWNFDDMVENWPFVKSPITMVNYNRQVHFFKRTAFHLQTNGNHKSFAQQLSKWPEKRILGNQFEIFSIFSFRKWII